MGHSNPDADAVGASVGLYRVAQCMNREANIVVEDKDNISIREMMKHIDASGQYTNVFVNHNEVSMTSCSSQLFLRKIFSYFLLK